MENGKVKGMKILILMLALVVLSLANVSAVKAWTIEYDGSVLPQNAEPPWGTSGSGFESTDGDILTVNTTSTGCNQKSYWIKDIVDTAVGITVEARVRIGTMGDEGTIPDTAIVITDSEQLFKLVFLEDRIAEGEDSVSWENLDNYHLMDTTSDFHVYRITLQNGVANVYVDGVQRLTLAGFPYTRNYVAFGEIRGSCGGMNGLSYWDYVKVDAEGAVP